MVQINVRNISKQYHVKYTLKENFWHYYNNQYDNHYNKSLWDAILDI